MSASAAGPQGSHGTHSLSLKVFVRHIVVRDDSDPGPGKGEFDVTLGIVAGPPGMTTQRSSVRWQHSVWSGYTYDVHAELGPIAVPEDGWISLAGAGVERDPLMDDQVRGGLTMLGRERRFGIGQWFQTTNGKHFDLIFTVVSGDAGAAACPPWTGEVVDAPCPTAPTEAEYRAILPAGFDRRLSRVSGTADSTEHDRDALAAVPRRELKHTYIPAHALMASEGFLPP
jgi:hypothetical protein